MNPHGLHFSKPIHDGIALAAAAITAVSARALGEWLQVAVLLLTIAFLVLGIALRWRKLRKGEDGDEAS